MLTIKVLVDDLLDGDIIVEELFTKNTNISLFPEGTLVTKEIKEKLIRADVDDILISRQQSRNESLRQIIANPHIIRKIEFKEDYKEKVSDYKDIFQGILSGGEIDLLKVSNISDDIFENIDEIYMAIESISELKGFDEYTYIHSVNVALYSMLLGKWLELGNDKIKDLVKAAVLHGIGKSKIDKKIINKPGELTEEEFTEMKKYPQYGYDICKDRTDISDEAKEAILSHHERIDGSGYPNGLKGDEISLFAKIIGVCDVYDAVTSDRAYKDKITPFKAYNEIKEHGYGKLDTEIMLTFLDNIGSLYVGLNVKMNTGEIGKIVLVPHQRLMYPLVKIEDKFIDFATNDDYEIEEIV